MTTLFRKYGCRLLPALLLAAGTASAQVAPALPLAADPARAAYAPSAAERLALRRGTTALALPFFDDFTSPLEGRPKVQNWLPTGGALVSNRLAVQPLTRGAATLDGLRANGQSYSGVINSSYGTIDSLTSQPINLGGLSTSDQVYLSFGWQAGSIVGVPNGNTSSTPVRLELFLKTNTGTWESAWVYRSARQRTPFKQQVIDLNAAKYLHGDFQFMFIASGNTSDNSDGFSVDYVVLDRGRTRGLADTTFVDIATSAGLRGGNPSGGLRSPLRRFAAMPVWQFNAAAPPTSELNPRLGVNISNLNAGLLPIPINVFGTVRELPAGAPLGNWLQASRALPVNPRQDSVTGHANRVAVPTSGTPKTLRYTLALNTQEGNPRTLPNDTIFRDVELNNYYAYDDGTAENITQLIPYSTGQASAFAYRFDLNQPDYVRALRLYPVFTASDRASRSVTVSVWDDASGQPNPVPRAAKTVVMPNPLPTGWQYFEVTFDQPVRVTGSFYVGFSQPSQGRDLHYGLDLNSTFPAKHLWRRDNTGAWDTANFVPRGTAPRGALMMRPVMTNNVATATAAAREAAAYSLYPNPAHGTVSIAGPAFARAAVLDAVGRTIWEQPTAQAGQPKLTLPFLPAGVYTVRLTLADGRTVGRRLLLE
ncbi:T9SS type A sorting domain-containing protein [Hymenobacter sedentarius]|uniref:T9SS type A sorting domain-containing protein n=1 Tax=Hymenobacter sedentarius TaxID=1411621 RepID=UPI000A8CB9C0|nr:T9SS type A sorting domain-containing protein [Hymenobacter sedentarius]